MKLGDLCGAETERLTAADDLMIDYIDISSVNNESKSIIGKQTLPSRVAPSRAQRVIKADDILVSTVRPNLNAVAVYDGSFENLAVASTGFCVLRCKPGVSHRFVFNVCKSNAFIKAMTEQATGASYPAVNDRIIRAFEVPDLDYESQTRLAGKLDSIQFIIDLRKQQLRELDDLIKARFVEMFGDLADPACSWKTCRLVESCENNDDIKCGPFGTQLSKDEYQSSGIPVWEIPQINSAFAIVPEHFLTVTKAKQLQAYTLVQGDIVMSRKGNVGKCALFPSDKQSGVLHSDVLRIRVSAAKADPCFMMYQLHYSRDVVRQIEQVSSGAIMAGVNVTKLKEILVKLPPLALQKQFAAFVSQVDKSKAVVQEALDKAQLLFDSLMQQYFG